MNDDSSVPVQVPVYSSRSEMNEKLEDVEQNTQPDFNEINTQEPEEQVTQNIDADEEDALPRGDAIGNTLYSERFVLHLFRKLVEAGSELENDKPFECQLGELWDMTTDRDVVLFLIQQGAIEIFVNHIESTEDRRMAEILVGIVGNMCIVEETCVALSKNMDLLKKILSLLTCLDVPTLIQTIRVLNAVARVFPRRGDGDEDKLFRFFIDEPSIMENICKLLSNSLVDIVLIDMMTTLEVLAERFAVVATHVVAVGQENGECEKAPCTFIDMFVNENAINSLNDAFDTLFPEHVSKNQLNDLKTSESPDTPQSPATPQTIETPNSNESPNAPLSPGGSVNLPTISTIKALVAYLSVHRINLAHSPGKTFELYEDNVKNVFKCINRALKPLCEESFLLPLDCDYVDMVSDVNSIFANCFYPFDEACFHKMLTIWRIAFQHLAACSEFERTSIEEHVDTNVFFSNIYMFIQCVACRSKSEELLLVLQYFNSNDIVVLLKEIDKYNIEDLHSLDINGSDPIREGTRDDKRLLKAYNLFLNTIK